MWNLARSIGWQTQTVLLIYMPPLIKQKTRTKATISSSGCSDGWKVEKQCWTILNFLVTQKDRSVCYRLSRRRRRSYGRYLISMCRGTVYGRSNATWENTGSKPWQGRGSGAPPPSTECWITRNMWGRYWCRKLIRRISWPGHKSKTMNSWICAWWRMAYKPDYCQGDIWQSAGDEGAYQTRTTNSGNTVIWPLRLIKSGIFLRTEAQRDIQLDCFRYIFNVHLTTASTQFPESITKHNFAEEWKGRPRLTMFR